MFKNFIIGALVSLSLFGCTRVTDSEVGIRTTFSGEIEDKVLEQGLHQTVVGNVLKVSQRNLVLDVETNPIVVEKIPMARFEAKVNYGIVSQNAAIAYKTEKARHIKTDDGELYLLGQYVEYVTKASIQDVISKYKALEVNDNRQVIEDQIKKSVNIKLKAQGKDRFVQVNEINIINVVPPQSITKSSERIVQTENELKAKQNELEIAQVEQEKMAVLAKQADGQYINLINAEANKMQAEALLVAAKKGTLNTMVVVPDSIKALGAIK